MRLAKQISDLYFESLVLNLEPYIPNSFLWKFSNIHRSRENGIMNPRYPSPNLNNYHYFAILVPWVFFKRRNYRAPPPEEFHLIGGVQKSPELPGWDCLTSGPGTGDCTCLKEIRRLPWCWWHDAPWPTEENWTSRGLSVRAQAGKNYSRWF